MKNNGFACRFVIGWCFFLCFVRLCLCCILSVLWGALAWCCCETRFCSAADRASATGSITNSVKRFGLCFSSLASQQELLKRYRFFLYVVLRVYQIFLLNWEVFWNCAHHWPVSLKHWQPQRWNVLCACHLISNPFSFSSSFSLQILHLSYIQFH